MSHPEVFHRSFRTPQRLRHFVMVESGWWLDTRAVRIQPPSTLNHNEVTKLRAVRAEGAAKKFEITYKAKGRRR